jgi:hypothetical protein
LTPLKTRRLSLWQTSTKYLSITGPCYIGSGLVEPRRCDFILRIASDVHAYASEMPRIEAADIKQQTLESMPDCERTGLLASALV